MASGPASDGAEPTVIVDDLHVVYRVYGAGGDKGTAATALMRVIKRQRRPSVREVHAIRGISFVINHGDAVGIIGRNGSGKSTLLQAIAGLLPPEQGCVYTSGQAALLGVNAALLDDLTGERNVVLGCLAMGMTPQETKDRYQSIVDFSGVGNFIDYPMRTYSTGMAQRLRFSIASGRQIIGIAGKRDQRQRFSHLHAAALLAFHFEFRREVQPQFVAETAAVPAHFGGDVGQHESAPRAGASVRLERARAARAHQ